MDMNAHDNEGKIHQLEQALKLVLVTHEITEHRVMDLIPTQDGQRHEVHLDPVALKQVRDALGLKDGETLMDMGYGYFDGETTPAPPTRTPFLGKRVLICAGKHTGVYGVATWEGHGALKNTVAVLPDGGGLELMIDRARLATAG